MSTERQHSKVFVVRPGGERWEVTLRRMFTGQDNAVIEVGDIANVGFDWPKGRIVLLAENNAGPVVLTPNQCRRLIAELEMRIRNAESVR